MYVRALETLCGRRVAVFGIRPDDGGVFADTLEKICGYAKAVWRGACFCASPSEEALGRCGALGEGAVRAREARPDLADTVPIIFSTITGNAYKLAAAVAEVVPDHVGPYNIRYINDEVIEKFDTFVLSYWCNHGTADDDTIELIRRMRGKNLIVIGTLGVARDSKHASDVSARVETLASENNRLLGHYLCRGSIDLRRTAARLRIPEGEKGHLSAERFEKQRRFARHILRRKAIVMLVCRQMLLLALLLKLGTAEVLIHLRRREFVAQQKEPALFNACLLYTSPSPRDS